MKLSKLYCNDKRFKTVYFKEGFNLILGSVNNKNKNDTHNLGKTTLVEIINYTSISITAWFAPPWRRPQRAETPEDILANRPASEEPTKRTVEVEQFYSWSPWRMSNLLRALTMVGLILYSSVGISKKSRKIFSI